MSSGWSVYAGEMGEHIARIVYVPDGGSIEPTFAVQNRKFSDMAINQSGVVRVCGGRVAIEVKVDGEKPSTNNLGLHWEVRGQARSWKPGELDHENLGAPFLALDNLWRDYVPTGVRPADPMLGYDEHIWNTATLTWAVEKSVKRETGKYPEIPVRDAEVRRLLHGQEPELLEEWPACVLEGYEVVKHSPPGLMTRSGLTIFRDDTYLWDAGEQWIRRDIGEKPIVLYLVHHDCDWKLAAGELVRLMGPVPRIDDSFLGIWYSNYTELGQKDLERIVGEFEKHELPLDIVSVDMDWHGKDWYGYEWSGGTFPDPPGFRKWLKGAGLKAAFNIHPLYVRSTDSRFEEFLEESGHGGEFLGDEGDWHPFQARHLQVDIYDKRQSRAYFDILHRDIERDGCDFWWIDGGVKLPNDRDEQSWANHVYREHQIRRGDKLPVVFSRAGGLGSHRDVVHFTGDTCSQWEILEFEVETIVRSAGALMPYVSHDIGGFYHDPRDFDDNRPPDDLFVRWVQFGCLSPIMRLHSLKGVREPWLFSDEVLEISRRFFNLRMRLLPVTTRLVEEAHATGLPICRPMWFVSDLDDAYKCLGQYMIGDDLLIAPVFRQDGIAEYWLPVGKWHDAFSERTLEGPCWVKEQVELAHIPMWLKDGAVMELAEPRLRVSQSLAGPRISVSGSNWA